MNINVYFSVTLQFIHLGKCSLSLPPFILSQQLAMKFTTGDSNQIVPGESAP